MILKRYLRYAPSMPLLHEIVKFSTIAKTWKWAKCQITEYGLQRYKIETGN